eukprot:2973621-Prymnesium_polylepis.1
MAGTEGPGGGPGGGEGGGGLGGGPGGGGLGGGGLGGDGGVGGTGGGEAHGITTAVSLVSRVHRFGVCNRAHANRESLLLCCRESPQRVSFDLRSNPADIGAQHVTRPVETVSGNPAGRTVTTGVTTALEHLSLSPI